MSSSVFFRFKSQKEPTRVAFDGTGISVFELKREIITINRLGDGSDFELIISAEDGHQNYDDDTTIIPRSTTVIAKRLPALRPGRGGAARYVSGKMPQAAKALQRTDQVTSKHLTGQPPLALRTPNPHMTAAQTEEERTAAVLQMGADQWAQQQQEMANVIPVHRNQNTKSKSSGVPNHAPPHGYICHRCEQPGHYIQNCPTNDDPAYDNRPRVKRTTGIPKSFLKTVEKPLVHEEDPGDESKRPIGVMMNSEGDWVVAEPDQAAFHRFQAKAKVSAAAHEAASQGVKDLQERGLECSIDHRLFVDPTKTPCCQTVYCHECITNSLLENDLRCPSCSTENILVDDLKIDEDMVKKVQIYEEEQRTLLATHPRVPGDTVKPEPTEPPSSTLTSIPPTVRSREASPASVTSESRGTKRPAECDIVNTRTPPPPLMSKSTSSNGIKAEPPQKSSNAASKLPPAQQPSQVQGTADNVNFANFNGMMGFPASMAPGMPLMSGMFDPMMMHFMNANNGNWNNMWNPAMQQQMMGQFPNGFSNNMMGHEHSMYNQQNMSNMAGNANHNNQGSFPHQQRHNYGNQGANDEDSAYFRKPVNPHRHQARRNVNRPADYREI